MQELIKLINSLDFEDMSDTHLCQVLASLRKIKDIDVSAEKNKIRHILRERGFAESADYSTKLKLLAELACHEEAQNIYDPDNVHLIYE